MSRRYRWKDGAKEEGGRGRRQEGRRQRQEARERGGGMGRRQGKGRWGKAPLRVTVVVIHQTSTRREDCNALEGVANQGIESIPRVALYGSPYGPDIAEGKDVLDAQLGAVGYRLQNSWEVGWQ